MWDLSKSHVFKDNHKDSATPKTATWVGGIHIKESQGRKSTEEDSIICEHEKETMY